MTDALAKYFPVSVKGVIEIGSRFVLLKNERDEWELPGGKLELGEAVEDCLVREVKEEIDLATAVQRPLNNWVYHVNGVDVLIITYSLMCLDSNPSPKLSEEHKSLGLFGRHEIANLRMPDGYKRSIVIYQERYPDGSGVKKSCR